MAITGTINEIYSLPGISIQGVITRSAVAGVAPQDVALPAADPGELTTRTDDHNGTLTMDSAGHGIETGDIIDIYWDVSGGGIAYKATVGTVASTTVPFTTASGDNLPAQGSDVVADVRVDLDVDVDGDLLEIIACMSASTRGHVHFQENGGTSILAKELTAGEPWRWIADTGLSNPLTGNPVGVISVSNGSATTATTFQLGGVYNSDS